jgi:hypothetical protein
MKDGNTHPGILVPPKPSLSSRTFDNDDLSSHIFDTDDPLPTPPNEWAHPLPLAQPPPTPTDYPTIPGAEDNVLGTTDIPGAEVNVLGTTPPPDCNFTTRPPSPKSVMAFDADDPDIVLLDALHSPHPPSLQDSVVHIVGQTRVCGISGDPRSYSAMGPKAYDNGCGPSRLNVPTPKAVGLVDSGANLCMTHDPLLQVDVRPCPPFHIGLATQDGSPSKSNVCQYCGLLPVPLLDGTYYYQQCYVNPHSSDTFISAQAIIDSSDGLFDHWQLDGYSSGRPGSLAIYSPSGLLKISIPLVSQEGLYYCKTDTFTVATNPRLIALKRRTCKLDFTHPVPHLVEDDDSSDNDDDDGEPTLDASMQEPPLADDNAHDTTPLPDPTPTKHLLSRGSCFAPLTARDNSNRNCGPRDLDTAARTS